MNATNNIDIENVVLHSYDFKPLIKTFVFQQWQVKWSRTRCFLQGIKPTIGDWKSAYRDNRKEEIVLARLRTNTPYFMHQHKLGRTPPPRDICLYCTRRQTVFHLTRICPRLTLHRSSLQNHFNSTNLSINACNLLGDNAPLNLLFRFLREVNYFNKI